MKIMYITSRAEWGGATVALYRIIKQLYKHHEIFVILPDENGRLCKELENINIPYYSLGYSLNIYYKSWNVYKFLSNTIKRIIGNEYAKKKLEQLITVIRPDIVHCNVGPIDISLDICRKYHIPHVWHMREYQDLDFGMTFIPSKSYFRKKIHCDGNTNIAITKGVFQHWSLRENKDYVIYDPVIDDSLIYSEKDLIKENYFLFVGRVEEAKGLYDVLQAFQMFKNNNDSMRLKIAGAYSIGSKYYKKCCRYIQENRLEKFVDFLGQREDVYNLMRHARAQVIASRFEGFGFITAEAMFNKCLVVGRDTAGTKEQMDNGLRYIGKEIALRFSTLSELCEKMHEALLNDNDEMVENAYKTVTNKYTASRCADEIEKLYIELSK